MEKSRDDFVIAIRSAFLKKETKQRFSLLALIFFSIIFLILGSFNFKSVDYLKITLKDIVYRVSFIASVPENFIKKNYSIINNHLNLYDQNKKNILEIESLQLKDLTKKIITLENIKYKKLIDDYFIKVNETYAKVLIDKQSPFLRSVIINKGSKNNIKLGMIALDEDYLVGKVVEVNFLTSRVLLISDINSKIPVTLQPGDKQAIMSGKDFQKGILQYTKDKELNNYDKDLLVLTSGAGGIFKSGIPIGKIKVTENILDKNDKVVHFFKDFSQLQYVKIVSYSKENETIDRSSKITTKEMNDKIAETNQQNENLRILIAQKKIAEEIKKKIEEENNILKNENIFLQNALLIEQKINLENENKIKEIRFFKLKKIYGVKCKKTFYNKLYKEGTKEYRNCILKKGIVKN